MQLSRGNWTKKNHCVESQLVLADGLQAGLPSLSLMEREVTQITLVCIWQELGRLFLHPVLSTVLQRLGLGVLTLFIVSIIIFSSIALLPGDFGEQVLGQQALPETVEAFRRELGLDKPAYLRYIDWIAAVLQGDLGTSFSGRASSGSDQSRSVWELVGPRLSNTLFLAGFTALIAVPLSLFLGITAALKRNSIYDRSVNAVTLLSGILPGLSVDRLSGRNFPDPFKRVPRHGFGRAHLQDCPARADHDAGYCRTHDAYDPCSADQLAGQPLY
jgi:hypothetical protein